MNPTMNGESLWPRLADLPLVIEACGYERLHAVLAHDFERVTTHVRLAGEGTDGLGEDVSIFREDGTSLHETRPELGLEGEWTLVGFCDNRDPRQVAKPRVIELHPLDRTGAAPRRAAPGRPGP
jgi:hypothetical protein